MSKTPFAIIAMTAIVALGGYAVCNRPFQTAILTGQNAAPGVADPLDPKVQSVIDDLCRKWENVEKLSVALHTQSPGAAGFEGNTKGTGNYAYQKTDGDPLIRLHLRNMMTIEKETTLPDGRISPTLFTGEVLVTMHDGEALWVQISQFENEKLYKRKYDSSEVFQLGGRALWDTFTIGTAVKILPDEKLEEAGGADTYVFSVAPLDGDWTSKHWFDKKTGLRLKTVEQDLSGTDTLTLWLDEIDFAPEFAEDRFVFEIPEGWEVIDETGEPDAPQTESP